MSRDYNSIWDEYNKAAGRVGLDSDWDKFMFFELNPNYNVFIEQIEMYSIRLFASILKNQVGIKELNDKNIVLVNKQLKKNK